MLSLNYRAYYIMYPFVYNIKISCNINNIEIQARSVFQLIAFLVNTMSLISTINYRLDRVAGFGISMSLV